MSEWRRLSKNYEALTVKALADAIYESDQGGIRGAQIVKADQFVDRARAEYRGVGASPAAARAGERSAQIIKRVDGGEDYLRKKKFKGSKMPVQLISTRGAYWSVYHLEFGSGRKIPAMGILRRLTTAMGGRIGGGREL
jgi:hypothetical protein